MHKENQSLQVILEQGILPLYFHANEEISCGVLKALYKAGIKAVEYTNRGAEALPNFKKLVALRNFEMADLRLGIGTIKTAADALKFIEAGADYIISPGFVPEVAEVSVKKNVIWIPGCMTPSEIIAAEAYGAEFIKLFPGNTLGPGFMSAIKDLFPNIKFMPTGGVELDKKNIEAWFHSGVSAVGMGSKLISKELMDSKSYEAIYEATKKSLEIISELRRK